MSLQKLKNIDHTYHDDNKLVKARSEKLLLRNKRQKCIIYSFILTLTHFVIYDTCKWNRNS